MGNSVIVTVQMKQPSLSLDMELPCNIPIGVLQTQLLEGLKAISNHQLDNCRKIKILNNFEDLDKNESLAEAGIWDGSYLNVEAEVWHVDY